MNKGIVRINPKLQKEVEGLLNKNNNRVYCPSLARFIDVAVRELLDKIKKRKNKIRWKIK